MRRKRRVTSKHTSSPTPSRFQCDVFLINDLGNTSIGDPELSISERGDVRASLRSGRSNIRFTRENSGAPDAPMTLIKTLAALTDDDGSAAVQGVPQFDWEGADFPDTLYRASSGVLDGVKYVGRGTLATRLWSSPSVTVLGIDAPSVEEASNILHASARARISMRLLREWTAKSSSNVSCGTSKPPFPTERRSPLNA